MKTRTHASIVVGRVAALFVMIASVTALWKVMLWLPWQADCVMATAAAFAFAYIFEREESH